VDYTSSDSALLERVRKSDFQAFRTLFEHYQPILFRHVLFQVRGSDAAHDIVQETFIRVWEHRTSLDPRLSFAAYITRISGNLLRDDARRRKRRERRDAEMLLRGGAPGEDPAQALERVRLEEELSRIIGRLPERCRAVFLLSRIEGTPNLEIARMLGISVRTVEHQINHALKVIRKRLGRYMRNP
jgi:RNA polymerase sigma-70 factor (ECF subfamily)